jgi:hydroxyacylglutathione hydrolase
MIFKQFYLPGLGHASYLIGSKHIRGAVHISGGELPRRIEEVPRNRPIAVHCDSGYRSSVAASLLKAKGCHQVFHVPGGFHAWKMRGFPVED